MRTLARSFLGIPLLMAVVACSGSSTPAVPETAPAAPAAPGAGTVETVGGSVATIARPAGLTDLATVTVVSPAETDAGLTPTFAWEPVDGATVYRLVVLGPDAPRWGWSGAETSVRYGGGSGAPGGPTLVPGSWWSVAAMSADGTTLALSELRAVSPGADPGPDPAWASGLPVAATPESATPETADAPAGELTACSLVTTDELESFLGRTFHAGAPSGFAITSDDCEFGTDKLASLNVDLSARSGFHPDLWAPDHTPVPGLGEDSFSMKSGMDRKVGFVRGDHAVLLSFSFGRVDEAALIELAKAIDAKL